jgi:hypothetical protein
MSDNEVHLKLLRLVNQRNSRNPIATRFQTHPDRVEQLLGSSSDSTHQARSGTNSFATRPFQYRRPRPIPLQRSQRQAAVDEIERLITECRAIEVAPEHDGDKALSSSAEPWERRPLRQGNGPRERIIPIISSWQEQREYDQRCSAEMRIRRNEGKPYRDFELTVFTVNKKSGGLSAMH